MSNCSRLFLTSYISCQKCSVSVILPRLRFLVYAYPIAPPLPMMRCCFLHHLTLCQLFRLPIDSLFFLYHWLYCMFICWCLIVHLWSHKCCKFSVLSSSSNYCSLFSYSMYYVSVMYIPYFASYILIFCPQFIYCSYLSYLPHLHLPEFDCCQVW